MTWETRAAALAEQATHRRSRWRGPVATTPRHLFVPRWWHSGRTGWALHDGPSDEGRWLETAYADASLITRVGPEHADHAQPDDHPTGRPTSSATLPSLVVRMFQHARLGDGDHLLDVGTGSGYGAALAARRLGEHRVTSVDIDPYLVQAARERLDRIGLHPTVAVADATGELPEGAFDRIVATVAVRPVPVTWLKALRPGGRLVATIAGTSLLVTADKDPDGGATGRVEWDRAGFMHARNGDDYPPGVGELLAQAREEDGEEVTTGPYPVVDVAEAWDLASMLDLISPGIEHDHQDDGEQRTALMAHPDGSWARATAHGTDHPTVHQGGPRRLWNLLDQVRAHWLSHGELPVRGARVFITPDGRTILARGGWHTVLT
ncbi:methyltransferase domain-containing protein [Streptomyces capparidis]